MILTGKNKEQFEKWYNNKYVKNQTQKYIYGLGSFYLLDLNFQIGVLLAYYDSLEGIQIQPDLFYLDGVFQYSFVIYTKQNDTSYIDGMLFSTRNEALKEAFKKADEIVNK